MRGNIIIKKIYNRRLVIMINCNNMCIFIGKSHFYSYYIQINRQIASWIRAPRVTYKPVGILNDVTKNLGF